MSHPKNTNPRSSKLERGSFCSIPPAVPTTIPERHILLYYFINTIFFTCVNVLPFPSAGLAEIR